MCTESAYTPGTSVGRCMVCGKAVPFFFASVFCHKSQDARCFLLLRALVWGKMHLEWILGLVGQVHKSSDLEVHRAGKPKLRYSTGSFSIMGESQRTQMINDKHLVC